MKNERKEKLRLLIVFCLLLVCLSCSLSNEKVGQGQQSNDFGSLNALQYSDSLPKLTAEQQSAFDALNSIQRQGKHLYSTFSGIHHECFAPDTTFVISQSELLVALEILLERYYTNIDVEQRDKLANESVLAQEEYLVVECSRNSNEIMNDKSKNIPNSGSWILPEILGRRDVIIEW